MKLDLKEFIDKVCSWLAGVKKDTLWSGAKTTSGTITLSNPYTDYDFLNVFAVTNVDTSSCTFDTNAINSLGSTYKHGVPICPNTSLNTMVSLQFPSTTSVTVSSTYNSSNFIAGITKIIGIKLGGYCVIRLLQGFQPPSRLEVA